MALTRWSPISGLAALEINRWQIKTNRGELVLTASNLFNGDVEIKGGLLTMTHGSALGNTNGVTKLISGTLAINPLNPFGIPEYLEVPGPNGTLQLVDSSASWLDPSAVLAQPSCSRDDRPRRKNSGVPIRSRFMTLA